jgi:hypothetical protein
MERGGRLFTRDVSKRPSLLSPLMIPCGSNLAFVCVKWVSKFYSQELVQNLNRRLQDKCYLLSFGAMTKLAPASTQGVTRGTQYLSM